MFIFRLLFIICAIFLLLVFGMATLLALRIRSGFSRTFMHEDKQPRRSYKDDGNVIEGDYKVLDESPKDRN